MMRRVFGRHLLRVAALVVALSAFGTSDAGAQTPSNTWIATTDGVWSVGTNWDTGTAPVPGATTTVLQFNASGTTAYTANNDIADPFSLLGLQFKGTAGTAITLSGGALTLAQSGT